jgi:hypothetical protein
VVLVISEVVSCLADGSVIEVSHSTRLSRLYPTLLVTSESFFMHGWLYASSVAGGFL